mgnify:CR=1 FL=1
MNTLKTSMPSLARAPTTVSVDTTLVLSADSALFPAGAAELQDRDCNDALASLLVYLCNGRKIAYVRPGLADVRETVPLLKVVAGDAVKPDTLPLNPTFDSDRLYEAAGDFASYMGESEGHDVLSWVRFQFAEDKYARIFFDGSGISAADAQGARLQAAFRALERADRLKLAERKWRESGGSEVSLPGQHAEAARQIGINHSSYSLAYAFFGFAKGQTYALQLPDEIRSCEHWLRAIAGSRMRKRLQESPDGSGFDPVPDSVCFNWGYYLPAFFRNCTEFRTPDGLASVVARARKETTADAIAGILAEGRGRSGAGYASAITAASNQFASTVLVSAGWTPPLRDPEKFWARQSAVVGGAIGVGAVVAQAALGGPPAIAVGCGAIVATAWARYVYATKPGWYQRVELQLRRFTKASLRPDFDVDQIARWAEASSSQ